MSDSQPTTICVGDGCSQSACAALVAQKVRFVIAYLKLKNVAGLHDELTRCQDVVRVVLVLVGPVQVEGRVSAEAGGADGVGVEAPALLMGSALWLVGARKRREVSWRSQLLCPSH